MFELVRVLFAVGKAGEDVVILIKKDVAICIRADEAAWVI